MSKHNRPIKTIRAGNIKAAIWENKSDDESRVFHTVTVVRTYRSDDDWKESVSFGRDDLPKLELVTRKAFEFIHLKAENRGHGETFAERIAGENGAEVAA